MLAEFEAFTASEEIRQVRRREAGMGFSVQLFDGTTGIGATIESALDHARQLQAQWRRNQGFAA